MSYSSFYDCGEREYDDSEIDWDFLLEEAATPAERAAIIQERAEAEARIEYQRWLDERAAAELAQERDDARQWVPEEGDDIPF